MFLSMLIPTLAITLLFEHTLSCDTTICYECSTLLDADSCGADNLLPSLSNLILPGCQYCGKVTDGSDIQRGCIYKDTQGAPAYTGGCTRELDIESATIYTLCTCKKFLCNGAIAKMQSTLLVIVGMTILALNVR